MLPTHQEDRALFQALASKNHDFVVAGVIALWNLFFEEDWIIKERYEERIEEMIDRFGIVSEEFDVDEIGGEEASELDEDLARIKARYVYRLLRSKGWFEEVPERVGGRVSTTLNVGPEAAALAEFVAKRYSQREREAASCVYAAKAVIEKARDSYERLEKNEMGEPVDPVAAKRVGAEFVEAVRTCRERAESLTVRLRTATHSYRKKSREVVRAADVRELARLMKADYARELFGAILKPLRVEDGFERFSPEIVAALQSWAVDDRFLGLVRQALDGDVLAVTDVMLDLAEARDVYGSRARPGMDGINDLDVRFVRAMSDRYRILAGGVSSAAARLEDALRLMSASNGRDAELAAESFCEVANVAPESPFAPSDVKPPARVTRTAKRKGVKVDFAARHGSRPPETRVTRRKRADAAMASRLERSRDGVWDVRDEPPHTRSDRVLLMDCIQSALSSGPYVVVGLGEGNIRTAEVSVPAVVFSKKGEV